MSRIADTSATTGVEVPGNHPARRDDLTPMTRTRTRLAAAAGTAAAAIVLGTGVASAHIGTSADEVAAGSTIALGLTVGHGCGESPTREVAIQIPEGINNAQPFAHPGWSVASEIETLATPVTSAHGEEITDRVSVITYTADAGNELPNEVRDTFTVNFTAPDTPGETLYFKMIQSCTEGSNDWIEEYDGTGEEPEHPAPSITVTESTGEGEHGEGEHGEEAGHDEGATDVTEVAADVTSSTSEGDGNGSGLAVVGIVIGALGLATGGAALSRSRTAG